jgi:phosphatidylglycerophosphatase C
VIVTASPETVVAPIARGLGADALLGTRLAFDAGDRITGDFEGENCRGPEKVRRLRAAFGDDVRLEAAYGDTDGDKEMLALAEEQGMRVFNGIGRSVPR